MQRRLIHSPLANPPKNSKSGWLKRQMYKRNMASFIESSKQGRKVMRSVPYKLMKAAFYSYGYSEASKAFETEIKAGRISVATAKSVLEKVLDGIIREISHSPNSTVTAIMKPKSPHEFKTGVSFLISQEFHDPITGVHGKISFTTNKAQLIVNEKPKQ